MPKTTDSDIRTAFAPYDEATQPRRFVEGYQSTQRRTPLAQPVDAAPGLTEITGPCFDLPAAAGGVVNLAVDPATGRRAIGPLMLLSGRVLDEDGRPVRRSLVELWQANGGGRYAHAADDNVAPLDPNFQGVGRTLTDDDGRYAFLTIKPGAYPVPGPGNWWRPPHIHFSLFGTSWMSRLVTQMYFPGEPLNAQDHILNAIPDAAARERVLCRVSENPLTPSPALGFTFDIVLRGRAETPWVAP
ncbi:MAG: protocatechuate 3,4-dioxygenase subunit beta [Alphaproteobacteria bacterium]|nr:protocatechuate 3,4-dioxygenase subunit beta [Alphaproteobacteria bacterium]